MSILQMPARTYNAKLFEAGHFKIAGTLDGFIDLSTPTGIYPLTLAEAEELKAVLSGSIADVKANCLYDSDALLEKAE